MIHKTRLHGVYLHLWTNCNNLRPWQTMHPTYVLDLAEEQTLAMLEIRVYNSSTNAFPSAVRRFLVLQEAAPSRRAKMYPWKWKIEEVTLTVKVNIGNPCHRIPNLFDILWPWRYIFIAINAMSLRNKAKELIRNGKLDMGRKFCSLIWVFLVLYRQSLENKDI